MQNLYISMITGFHRLFSYLPISIIESTRLCSSVLSDDDDEDVSRRAGANTG
jgi:hypothetical protein